MSDTVQRFSMTDEDGTEAVFTYGKYGEDWLLGIDTVGVNGFGESLTLNISKLDGLINILRYLNHR